MRHFEVLLECVWKNYNLLLINIIKLFLKVPAGLKNINLPFGAVFKYYIYSYSHKIRNHMQMCEYTYIHTNISERVMRKCLCECLYLC